MVRCEQQVSIGKPWQLRNHCERCQAMPAGHPPLCKGRTTQPRFGSRTAAWQLSAIVVIARAALAFPGNRVVRNTTSCRRVVAFLVVSALDGALVDRPAGCSAGPPRETYAMIRTSRYRLYNVAANAFTPRSSPLASEGVPPSQDLQDPSPPSMSDDSSSRADSDADRSANLRSGD